LKPTARSGPDGLLVEGPVAKPESWTRFVNRVETEAELKEVRQSVKRGTPFGDLDWQAETADQLGLESSLRQRGQSRLDLENRGEKKIQTKKGTGTQGGASPLFRVHPAGFEPATFGSVDRCSIQLS
jgi:hypothetical protein